MIKKTLSKIRSSRVGYNLGRKILSTPFIVNSKVYDKIYNKKINKTINELNKGYPLGVDIGTTNLCNAACIMCPHSKLKKMGTMDMNLYKKIIDNCARLNIKIITLSFFGEPFLDKKIIEKIKYAKGKGMSVGFYSNASLLTEKLAKEIIEAKLDNITISFDGATKETYEKIRKNLKFEATKKNVLGLINTRKKLNKKNPKINLVLVELEENKKEIKQFYQYWKGKVDSINIINMRNWANDIQKEGTKESFHFNKKIKRKPCALIWLKMVVDWNGEVVLCCDDWNHSTIIGNLKNQTIEEVWKGERLRKIREAHLRGEFYKVPLCAGCNKKSVWWLY